jgi:two-component system, LytTR family, response regulator
MVKFAIMNLTCYIVDDEPHAINILKDFVQKTPGLVLAGFAEDPLVALEEITTIQPALTFLDVDMPELNGLKFAAMAKSQTTVIFTTAYREYAVEAFETEAVDYLLKPIAYERFLTCIQKIRKNRVGSPNTAERVQSSLFVKSGMKDKLLRVDVQDIVYISGFDHYIEIHVKEQKIVTYLKLSEILAKLPEQCFTRIHRSHIINHNSIRSVEPGQVKLADETLLPIGPTYKEPFRQKLHSINFVF